MFCGDMTSLFVVLTFFSKYVAWERQEIILVCISSKWNGKCILLYQ